jgi:cell division protease FtsH
MVMRLPENDRISVSRNKLMADIKVAMGGRLAEEMIFGHGKVTTGASSDIKMATDLARRMIMEWGMSDKLGFQTYRQQDDTYLGMGAGSSRLHSEATAQTVDDEVSQLIDTCFVEAKAILKKHEKKLHVLGKALLERETLTGEEIRVLLEGGTLPTEDQPPLHAEVQQVSSVPTA